MQDPRDPGLWLRWAWGSGDVGESCHFENSFLTSAFCDGSWCGAGGGCCKLGTLRMGWPSALYLSGHGGGGCRLQVIYSPLAFSRQGGVIFLTVSWLGSNLDDYTLPV